MVSSTWVSTEKLNSFVRTEKIVYRTINLYTNTKANRLIASLEHRPEFAVSAVRTLQLRKAVEEDSAAQILDICKGITDLTLYVTCYFPFGERPILKSLGALALTTLSIDLLALFYYEGPYLPNLKIAYRITHLHLNDTWVAWRGATIGLARLTQLSHLSLRWTALYRSDLNWLREILESTNLKVLVLWRSKSAHEYKELLGRLSHEGLKDRRIVLLNSKRYAAYLEFGGFWGYAEDLVKWREEVDGMSFSALRCGTLLNKHTS